MVQLAGSAGVVAGTPVAYLRVTPVTTSEEAPAKIMIRARQIRAYVRVQSGSECQTELVLSDHRRLRIRESIRHLQQMLSVAH